MIPPAVARIDPGAEYYGLHPEGTVWLMCTKPPSGIERDWFAVATKAGVREIKTDEDFDKVEVGR